MGSFGIVAILVWLEPIDNVEDEQDNVGDSDDDVNEDALPAISFNDTPKLPPF